MKSALHKLSEHPKKPVGPENTHFEVEMPHDWDNLKKSLNGFWKSLYEDIME